MASVETAPTEKVESARLGIGYRPHLDGLRAVAVYLVLLFHAGSDRFSGGFIGVDVFFVLSGYLVTQLLMRDLDVLHRLRFGRFYARRMRRLLPASLAALVVTGVVYSAVASPADAANAVNAFKAAFLYVANWFFIHRSSDYFATATDTNPVTHFWSLAVEEQFYLLWPILLTVLFVATRRLRDQAHRAMQITVAVAAVASMLWALRLSGTNLNRAYYGTDARAYQLLAGALLALSPGILRRVSRRRREVLVAALLAVAALLVLSTSLIDINAIRRGIATTIVTVVLIAAIETARGGPVNRLLASGPAVYLGKISYGTYLWHWPVIVVTRIVLSNISPDSTFAIAALVATGLASLSYQVLERPIREQRFLDRISPIVVGAGLTIGVVTALVIMPSILDAHRTRAAAVEDTAHTGFTPIPKFDFLKARSSFGGELPNLALGLREHWDCVGKPAQACTIVKGGGPHILVIGDSNAWMMAPTFAKLAQEQHLTWSRDTVGGCPWQHDLYITKGTDNVQRNLANCRRVKPDLYKRVLPQLKPDVIIVFSVDWLDRTPGTEFDQNNRPIRTNSAAQLQRLVKADTERSLAELRKWAPKVVIVEPFPTNSGYLDPLACLMKSKFLEACRFMSDDSLTKPMEDIYRAVADNKHVYAADFDKLLCPYDPICDPVIDGNIVRFDPGHITPKFALTLVDPITAFLRDEGILRGG